MLLFGTLYWRTGSGIPTPPTPPAPDATPPPRGRAAWLLDVRRRSREEIRRDRQRFGLIPPDAIEAIEEVAARQAFAREQTDEQRRFDELFRELELRRIEFDARYLELLTELRSDYLVALKKRMDEEEVILLLMMAASAV